MFKGKSKGQSQKLNLIAILFSFLANFWMNFWDSGFSRMLSNKGSYLYSDTAYRQERREYNEFRPHSSLKDLTPDEIYYEPEKSPISLLETVAEIWE
ncbi:MAG: hypothetical protein DRJ29_17510 [Bacteroidetes bacterium]|nr:MAG: hypothetical protein DRJ29_17510 [Bacteroidota bacterium]